MAAKNTNNVKAPKANEKKNIENTPVNQAAERPAYKIPFITARIDRMSDDPNSKIRAKRKRNHRQSFCSSRI